MVRFLKKYSPVPKKFIDDFFGIMGENYNTSNFSVNLDVVAKWLKKQKANLKRIVVKNATENEDYIIKEIKKPHENVPGSTMEETILMTPDTFKKLCMSITSRNKTHKRSNNKDICDTVREYYVSLEALIFKYHDYIEEGLCEKIRVLEENQKPKVHSKKGIVYFSEAQNIPEVVSTRYHKAFQNYI